MSKATGYALRPDDDGHRAVAVSTTGPRSWSLVASESARGGQAFSADLARRLERAQRHVAWLMPDAQVTCAQTPMPRLKGRELVRAVTGWVARQEGGAPDDWTVSWRTFAPAAGNAQESRQVALAYARRDVVAGHLEDAAAVGARPGLMLPGPLVLDQFFRAASDDADELSVWNLVFLAGDRSMLCVANRDGLLLTRPLPGAPSDGDRDEYLDRMSTEVDRSVFFARQSAGSHEVDGVFVGGDAELAPLLVDRLAEGSSVAARSWRFEDAVDCGETTLDPADQLLAMAAALATGEPTFNLAPRAPRSVLGAVGRRRVAVAAGAVAATLVPLLWAGGLVTREVQRNYLDDAHARLDEATAKAELAADVYQRQRLLRAREDLLAQRAGARRDLAGILRSLAAAAPPEVVFRDLQMHRRDSGVYLHLAGRSSARTIAEAQRAFMDFQRALTDMDEVRPLGEPRQLQIGEAEQEDRLRQTVGFTLECELLRPGATEEG